MAEITSPAEYFEQVIPQQFASAIKSASASVADQPELTATFDITGDGGDIYGVRINGETIEVVPGGIDGSDLRTILSYQDWLATVQSGATEALVDYVRRRKISVVKSLKGAVRLELTRSDGSTWESTTIFGNNDEPAVTLRMTSEDYNAMTSGELSGQMAFMTGKLKFEGSLPLLMQVGALSV
jgi:putative sterol carrier protein